MEDRRPKKNCSYVVEEIGFGLTKEIQNAKELHLDSERNKTNEWQTAHDTACCQTEIEERKKREKSLFK